MGQVWMIRTSFSRKASILSSSSIPFGPKHKFLDESMYLAGVNDGFTVGPVSPATEEHTKPWDRPMYPQESQLRQPAGICLAVCTNSRVCALSCDAIARPKGSCINLEVRRGHEDTKGMGGQEAPRAWGPGGSSAHQGHGGQEAPTNPRRVSTRTMLVSAVA